MTPDEHIKLQCSSYNTPFTGKITHRPSFPGFCGYLERLDDNTLIIKQEHDASFSLLYSLFAILGFVLLIFIFSGAIFLENVLFLLIIAAVCTDVFFRYRAIQKTRMNTPFIFHRTHSEVSFPTGSGGDTNTLHIKDIELKMKEHIGKGPVGGVVRTQSMYIQSKSSNVKSNDLPLNRGTGSTEEIYSQWSWILWYMDKNRPLPPESGLEEYRAADTQRLIEANRPEPLIPSNYYVELISQDFIKSVFQAEPIKGICPFDSTRLEELLKVKVL